MKKEELKKLFKKYHEGTCTEDEKALLEAWYLQVNEYDLDISPQKIKAAGKRLARELPGNHGQFIKAGITLMAAAISIGIMLTVGLKLSRPIKPAIRNYTQAINPGTNNAVLTLSTGQKINLKNSPGGQLASQAGIKITKTANGQVVYSVTRQRKSMAALHPDNITTPNGGQWQVTLPDGTKVWLNSATSLSYPATFEKQTNRIVQLKGEAYFEVAKDKLHPFVVQTSGEQVTVLGTHFNINAYADEPAVKTTLAEGHVKISGAKGQTRFLLPGQQAVLKNDLLTVSAANVEEALAWKNGYFRFNDEDIQSIMRKLSRWYGIQVKYGPNAPAGGLNGKISRFKNISQVLAALEATKTVHFKVEGRRVTVMK